MKLKFSSLLFFSLFIYVLPVQATANSINILEISVPTDLRIQGEASKENLIVFDCVLKQLDWPYNVRMYPWKRAIEAIKNGGVDAIFMATPTAELEAIAKMSAPFALEKWYWFYQPDSAQISEPLSEVKIGVVNSSHTEIWLERQGLKAEVRVNSSEQLINMLLASRIDTFIADEELIEEQLQGIKSNSKELQVKFSHYMPLGIYFSNQYLLKYPTFITGFNNSLKACNTQSWKLSADEKVEIKKDSLELQEHFSKVTEVNAWLKQENKKLKSDRTTGAEYDKQWMEQRVDGTGELLNRVELHPLSQWLRAWQADSNGLISEVYVTGIKGFNFAESQPTSDFDQSDEIEYESVILADVELFVGEIEYDESSQKFQINVAWAIKEQNQKIGMIVIGINIEAALQN